MKKFKTLSRFGQDVALVNVTSKEVKYDSAIVDRSYFVASVDIATRKSSGNLSSGAYDSPADIRKGFDKLVWARQKGRDSAELHQLSLQLDKATQSQMKHLKKLSSDLKKEQEALALVQQQAVNSSTQADIKAEKTLS